MDSAGRDLQEDLLRKRGNMAFSGRPYKGHRRGTEREALARRKRNQPCPRPNTSAGSHPTVRYRGWATTPGTLLAYGFCDGLAMGSARSWAVARGFGKTD